MNAGSTLGAEEGVAILKIVLQIEYGLPRDGKQEVSREQKELNNCGDKQGLEEGPGIRSSFQGDTPMAGLG